MKTCLLASILMVVLLPGCGLLKGSSRKSANRTTAKAAPHKPVNECDAKFVKLMECTGKARCSSAADKTEKQQCQMIKGLIGRFGDYQGYLKWCGKADKTGKTCRCEGTNKKKADEILSCKLNPITCVCMK